MYTFWLCSTAKNDAYARHCTEVSHSSYQSAPSGRRQAKSGYAGSEVGKDLAPCDRSHLGLRCWDEALGRSCDWRPCHWDVPPSRLVGKKDENRLALDREIIISTINSKSANFQTSYVVHLS